MMRRGSGSVILVSGREVEQDELSRFYCFCLNLWVDVLLVIFVVGGGVRLLLSPSSFESERAREGMCTVIIGWWLVGD